MDEEQEREYKLCQAMDLIQTVIDAVEKDDTTKHYATPLNIARDSLEEYMDAKFLREKE